jgi:SAM-dependent methyltransferase
MSDAAAERPDEAAAGTAGAGAETETETERAILATVGRGDLATASRLAATRRGTSPLVAALHRFMTRGPIADPYTEPAAFREFIESGDNPALYGAVIDALRDLHGSLGAEVVLDIGCGDGRVTAATLSESCRGVDLVEPSAELIEDASRRLADLGTHLEVRGHRVDALGFFDGLATDEQTWDLVQSTFALHTMPHHERVELLAHLRTRTAAVALVEFDVPPLEDSTETRSSHLAERYAEALEVYGEHPRVVDGFLMPVLIGQVLPGARRHTFEAPIGRWCDDLEAAGFSVTSRALFDHWWATAHLVVGT